MRAINALDVRALEAAVARAAEDLRLIAPPWKRPTKTDIAVLMSPRTYEVIGLASARVVDLAGYSVVLDPTVPPDTVRVRDRRNVRDEIVRLTL